MSKPGELFVPQQLFTADDAIGFSFGVTDTVSKK